MGAIRWRYPTVSVCVGGRAASEYGCACSAPPLCTAVLLWKSERKMVTTAPEVTSIAPPDSAVFSMNVHSMSVRLAALTMIAPAGWPRIVVRVRTTSPPVIENALSEDNALLVSCRRVGAATSTLQLLRCSSPPSTLNRPASRTFVMWTRGAPLESDMRRGSVWEAGRIVVGLLVPTIHTSLATVRLSKTATVDSSASSSLPSVM